MTYSKEDARVKGEIADAAVVDLTAEIVYRFSDREFVAKLSDSENREADPVFEDK
jgi:hypothetical protein